MKLGQMSGLTSQRSIDLNPTPRFSRYDYTLEEKLARVGELFECGVLTEDQAQAACCVAIHQHAKVSMSKAVEE